jgi:hypothetical protein
MATQGIDIGSGFGILGNCGKGIRMRRMKLWKTMVRIPNEHAMMVVMR